MTDKSPCRYDTRENAIRKRDTDRICYSCGTLLAKSASRVWVWRSTVVRTAVFLSTMSTTPRASRRWIAGEMSF